MSTLESARRGMGKVKVSGGIGTEKDQEKCVGSGGWK